MPKSWSTRREARTQPFTQYDETGLQALLDSFEARMTKLNDLYLRLMGEHIADIGTLWPSDVHRLQQIRRMNKNMHDIERRIAEVAGQSREEIETLFQRIAQEDVRMAGKILGAPDTVNVKDNLPLQRILRAQARETAGRMTNLSNSTALSGKYRDAVDVAVNAVQSGVEDYGSAIRRVIREAGQSGLRVRENGTRVVDYESGRSVRLDAAARMSVLDGVRHLNQSVMEEVGRQFGADGVEIDAHMLCAEDHVPYQGGQYSNEEFEQIQDSLQRPFGEWNCRHSWHPIMMGISPRTYTDDELSEMRRYSTEQIEIDGRTKTRYQWSQEMRRVETRIRQVKDTATLARYAGDDVLRRQCQQQIGILNERYTALAQGAGLKPEYQRTYVAGFRDFRLTGSENSGNIIGESTKSIKISDVFNKLTGKKAENDELISKSSQGSRVDTIRTYQGLSYYMRTQYGVAIDRALHAMRFKDIRQGIAGLDEILKVYPEVAVGLTTIKLNNQGVMSTTSDSVGFNPAYYAKGKGEAARFDSMVKGQAGGYWVQNASARSLGYHEGGHLVEGFLTRINSTSHNTLHWNDEWNRGIQADRIVTKACANLRQTPYGQDKTYKQMRAEISGYSMKSKSETFAEAFADCFRNGGNAKPLSQEILKIVNEEIAAYRRKPK